jgi:hypothetical protein
LLQATQSSLQIGVKQSIDVLFPGLLKRGMDCIRGIVYKNVQVLVGLLIAAEKRHHRLTIGNIQHLGFMSFAQEHVERFRKSRPVSAHYSDPGSEPCQRTSDRPSDSLVPACHHCGFPLKTAQRPDIIDIEHIPFLF